VLTRDDVPCGTLGGGGQRLSFFFGCFHRHLVGWEENYTEVSQLNRRRDRWGIAMQEWTQHAGGEEVA